MSEFCLNEKIWRVGDMADADVVGKAVWIKDVKEFIRLLKDNVKNITDGIERDNIKSGHILDRIDKLAGEELI